MASDVFFQFYKYYLFFFSKKKEKNNKNISFGKFVFNFCIFIFVGGY
jgi:hypothetical protein